MAILDRQTDRRMATSGLGVEVNTCGVLHPPSYLAHLHPCSWGFFSHCWRLPCPELPLRPFPRCHPGVGGIGVVEQEEPQADLGSSHDADCGAGT